MVNPTMNLQAVINQSWVFKTSKVSTVKMIPKKTRSSKRIPLTQHREMKFSKKRLPFSQKSPIPTKRVSISGSLPKVAQKKKKETISNRQEKTFKSRVHRQVFPVLVVTLAIKIEIQSSLKQTLNKCLLKI